MLLGYVGSAARWFGAGGARDSVRLAVALQPLASAVSAALWSKVGCYKVCVCVCSVCV